MEFAADEVEQPLPVADGQPTVTGLVDRAHPALTHDLEQISPELILVSPSDIAARARELLPEITLTSHVPGATPSPAEPRPIPRPGQHAELIALVGEPVTAEPKARLGLFRAVAAVGIALAAAAVVLLVIVVLRKDQTGAPVAASTSATAVSQQRGHAGASLSASPASRSAKGSHRAQGASAEPASSSAGAAPVLHAPPAATSVNPAAKSTPSSFVPSRVFVWPRVPQATFYVVRFFRDGRQVFQGRATSTRFVAPSTLRFTPGSYRWNVVGAFGSTAQPRFGAPIVDSSFTVSPPAPQAIRP